MLSSSSAVRDDVLLRAGLECADRDDGGVGAGDLPGHDCLQSHHSGCCHHDGVDGRLRPGPVAAAAEQHHPYRVGRCERGTGADGQGPGWQRRDVLAEHDVGAAEAVVEPVVDHGLGALPDLLGRLDDREHGPAPGRAVGGEGLRGAEQAGDMHVVPAAVHHRHLGAFAIDPDGLARVRQAGAFAQRQRVHVRPQQRRRAVPVPQHADDPGPPHPVGRGESGLPQPGRGDRGRPGLSERQLRMAV